MRSSGPTTCTYGLPGQAGFHFARSRHALRQSSLARARGVASPPAGKRKMRHDSDDSDDNSAFPHRVRTHPHGRVVVDEFGNRVLVDGLKRMRVSSPPLPTTTTTRFPTTSNTNDDDMAMDETESDSDATSIVPLHGAGKTSTPTLAEPAQRALKQFAAVPAFPSAPDASDPSCRAMVLFDPTQALPIERSPRIQLVNDSDADKSESESEPEEPFVRFEELPDDYQEEPEAMELD